MTEPERPKDQPEPPAVRLTYLAGEGQGAPPKALQVVREVRPNGLTRTHVRVNTDDAKDDAES